MSSQNNRNKNPLNILQAAQNSQILLRLKDGTEYKGLLKEIKGLQELVKYMYSQQEMDEVLAINTRLEEENIRLKSQK